MSKLKVIKRDGLIKDFDESRIISAVKKAYEEAELDVNIDILGDILKKVQEIGKDKEQLSVEEIQDIVVDILKGEDPLVGDLYEKYRLERNEVRANNSTIFTKIQEVFDNTSPEARDNANKSGDKVQSIRAMVADISLREYNYLKKIPKNLLKEHKKSIYVHDDMYFGLPFHNCFLINWRDMLENGFHINNTYIRQPNSLRTAVTLLSQIVAQCSSNCYGGVTLSDLCIGLEKYAKKSYEKYLKIAREENIGKRML